MPLEEAIRRERLSDELRALQCVNSGQLPNESYEDSLKRRAGNRLRTDEILRELSGIQRSDHAE